LEQRRAVCHPISDLFVTRQAQPFTIGESDRFGLDDARCLIVRPHVATAVRQQTLRIDADEDARADDLGGIEERPSLEDGPRHLDFSATLIDPVRQFVGVLVILLNLDVFGVEGS
jgi:hypothetical protein